MMFLWFDRFFCPGKEIVNWYDKQSPQKSAMPLEHKSDAVTVSLFFPLAVPSTTPTQEHFALSPVLLASRYQVGGPSKSTINMYDLTEK